MSETEPITRKEFEDYKKEIEKKINDANSKTTDVLVRLVELDTKFDNLNSKVNSIDKKLEDMFAKGRNNVNTVLMSCLTGTLGIIIAYVFSHVFSN